MKYLVTGAAGFIGMHLATRLLKQGHEVVGIDNLSDYYDLKLKKNRLSLLNSFDNFTFLKVDLTNNKALSQLFSENHFDTVINLAAQPGIRYSLKEPHVYIDSNIVGFANLIECCRKQTKPPHLVFASSSSVYGANTNYPSSETENVSHPISLYAATKKSNELIAHSYASLFNLPCTGLRFFTVYGPWGRPDMALFKFTKKILSKEPIEVYNNGNMYRDFTYISDIVDGILCVIDQPAKPDMSWSGQKTNPSTSYAPYRIYNVGCGKPAHLLEMIELLEKHLKEKAVKKFLPLQPGDVLKSYANISEIHRDFGFSPKVNLNEGIHQFVQWYLSHYK